MSFFFILLGQNKGWVAIGDDNYGEGSSREHAALEPRQAHNSLGKAHYDYDINKS